MMLIDVIHQKMTQFQDLRMKDIVVHKREGIVNLVMSYPKTLDQEVQQQILALCQDQVGANYKVNLTFQLDNMTTENAKKQFFDYIKQFAFALMNVKESQVKVSKNDLLFVFDLSVNPMTAEIIKAGDYLNQFKAQMAEKTCFKFSFNLIVAKDNKALEKAEEEVSAQAQFALSKELLKPRRYVQIDKVTALFGQKVKFTPKYICDVKEVTQSYTLCGSITSKKVIKPQKATARDMDICKLEIKDESGKINAVLFVRYQLEDPNLIMQMKGNSLEEATALADRHKKANDRLREKLMRLYEGDQVVATGKIQYSDYSKSFEMVINNLSKCKIVSSMPQSELVKPVPERYVNVKPQLIATNRQMSFVETETYVPEQLKGEYVVLYLNTTGDKILQDKILQIGAVKLVNGARRQAFFILVNCQMDVDEEMLKNIGETKARYQRSLTYLDVVADLYKFCHNTRIVTQNVPKVTAFLQYNSNYFGYHFNNQFVEISQLFDEYYNHNSDKKKPDCTDLYAVAKSMGVSAGKSQSAYSKAEISAKILSAMCE